MLLIRVTLVDMAYTWMNFLGLVTSMTETCLES